MIIDNHAHVRPSFKELAEWDYNSVAEISREAQKRVYDIRGYGMGVRGTWYDMSGQSEIRRVKDDAIVEEAWKILWDEERRGRWEGMCDVNFRIKGGRCLWEKDGVEYYMDLAKLWFPCNPDLLVSLMDKVGIDKAVLQPTPVGSLNKYTARVINKHPGRFIGLCGVGEGAPEEKMEELHMYIGELGLKGFYGCAPFEEKYDPWWREVSSLGIPVYMGGSLPMLKRLLEKFPDLTIIIVHGLQRREINDSVRETALDVVKNYDVYLEILAGLPTKDYDVRYLYETFGPSKLLWGSEFVQYPQPNATVYEERLHYLEKNCDYISRNDLSLMLGGNVQRIYKI